MISSPIDEIKERLDIVEVISSYVKLQKAGANFRALCPFHSEKKPSFFVSPSRQIWHCFGCGKGSDIFGFVKEIEGVEFGDALRILAQKAGVELRRQTPEYTQLKTERQKLYEICELATKFFEKQLEESKTGKEAKKYLLGRGISEESIKKWRLGYAPDVWQGLSDFLTSTRYKKEEVEKAGLGLTSEKGSFYDRFRGRIIFPIFDLNSQVVGFTGRVFKDKDKSEVAKYVNTPQTMLFDKGRILYGLDKAKVEIRKKDCCILVEGNTDAMMVSQAGFGNVVATSGTALTPFQLKILKRYSDNLLTAFDMDVAGESATKRGIDLAQLQGFNVKVVTLPEGKDPAELIQKNPKAWEESLAGAKSIMDFYFESTFSKFDKENPEGKREISKILLPVIKRIPNKIVQSHWLGELAKKLRVGEEDVEEELRKVKVGDYSDIYGLEQEELENLPRKSRKELLEERIIVLSLRSSQGAELVKKENPNINLSGISPEIALKSEIEEIEEKDILPEIEYCLQQLSSLELKDKLDKISKELKQAEEEKDSEKIKKLTQEFNNLAKQCQG